MLNVLKITFAMSLIAGLTGCVVVPHSAAYVEPGVTVVAPAPYYGHRHHHHHHRHHLDWGRRW